MKFLKYVSIFVVLFCLWSCLDKITRNSSKSVSVDLQFDHFNIWVENPDKAKERLISIGFTSVPDSLSMIHTGQGTSGRYFYFLNGYLELIFVYDSIELAENNEKNSDLDFIERAGFKVNGASPFSIALKVKDYDVDKIPFAKVRYHQDWMEEGESIYSAKNSKTNLSEPSIFVVYPGIEYEVFESLTELNRIPAEYAMWREFYKHPNGAQKITSVTIRSEGLDMESETMKVVNGIEIIELKNSTEHLMELHFDNDTQGKSFDLRPLLPLIVYL